MLYGHRRWRLILMAIKMPLVSSGVRPVNSSFFWSTKFFLVDQIFFRRQKKEKLTGQLVYQRDWPKYMDAASIMAPIWHCCIPLGTLQGRERGKKHSKIRVLKSIRRTVYKINKLTITWHQQFDIICWLRSHIHSKFSIVISEIDRWTCFCNIPCHYWTILTIQFTGTLYICT